MKLLIFMFIFCCTGLTACTNLQSLQDLHVSLVKIEPEEIQSLSPRFTIYLRVKNPNASDLHIEGMSFQLEIAEHQVFTGVSNQIPVLKAYSETGIAISANIHLYDLFKLLTHFSDQSNKQIKYIFHGEIDPKGYVPFLFEHEGLLTDSFLQGLNVTKAQDKI